MKVAVVTGASTGIGREVAKRLANESYFVFLVGRDKPKLQTLKDEIGVNSQIVLCDLSNVVDIRRFIDEIKLNQETVDVICNIAGVWHGDSESYIGRDFEKFSEKIITDSINVALVAPMLIVNGLLSVIPHGASVINLSGTFTEGAKGMLPYYVSKRSVEDFTVGLAHELERKKIKVNCVSPNDTSTEAYKKFFPQHSVGAQTPEIVAKFIIELTQKDVTGKVFVIKDGVVIEGFHK